MTRALELAKRFRRKIESGSPQWGTFLVELTAAGVPRILRNSGLDFTIIDNEHSTYSHTQTRQLLGACIDCELPCLVRALVGDVTGITKALDAGALGILFPRVTSLEEVQRAVELTKYPPSGNRGVHLLRPHTDFSVPKDSQAFYHSANDALLTCIQIETLKSLDLIEKIAAVEGVDALYIGPGDLSAALQAAGRDVAAEIRQTEQRVVNACKAEGKLAGIHFPPEQAQRLTAMGFQILGSTVASSMLGDGVRAFIEKVRG